MQDVEGLYEQVLASLGRAGIKLNTTQINHAGGEAGPSSATAAGACREDENEEEEEEDTSWWRACRGGS